VDSTSDSASGSCGPNPINGTCTLRAALTQANVSTGVQTIIVPVGTFRLTVTGSDDTGATGDLDILASRTVVIKGQGPANTIIDANGIDRVFDVQPGAAFILTDVKITGGSVSGASGAGLRNNEASATLDNVQDIGNTARASGSSEGDGGGIVNQNNGFLVVNNSVISGNSAAVVNNVGGYGGGIGNFTGSTANINNTEISNNSAGINGGGITQNQNGSNISLTNSTISGNVAVAGGGIASGGAGTTTVNLTTTTVTSNQATNGNGGGITMANQNAVLRITNSTLSNNTSPNNNQFAGGAIRIGGPGSSATITSSTIVNNSAFTGGAISNQSVNGSTASVSVAGSVFGNNNGGNCTANYGGSNNAESGTGCGFGLQNSNTGLSNGNPDTTEGFTVVFVPPTNSPLVDAASDCSGQSTDQRRVARPQATTTLKCDIGSVELQPTTNFNCATPSRLKVATTRASAGVLQVTISTFNPATNQIEPNNRIKSISFNASPNINSSNVIVLPTRPVVGGTQVTFQLIRPLALTAASASGAGTQPFTIVDRCGNYNSFAGGGVNAWQ